MKNDGELSRDAWADDEAVAVSSITDAVTIGTAPAFPFPEDAGVAMALLFDVRVCIRPLASHVFASSRSLTLFPAIFLGCDAPA